MKRARLLAFVITAAMATTVFLGGTVARYQTSANIDDTATVAKWGVKLTMAGNLYGLNYKNDGVLDAPNAGVIKTDETDDGFSVEAASGDTLDNVAPGTKGDILKFSLTGNTEVDTEITGFIKMQDVYLDAGKYAIMQKVTISTETEYESMIGQLYVYESNAMTLAATGAYSTNAVKPLYIMQNYTDLTGTTYRPLRYDYKLTASTFTENVDVDVAAKAFLAALGTTTPSDSDAEPSIFKYDLSKKSVEANTELSSYLGLDAAAITWKWVLDGNHNADTVLGALCADTAVGGDVVVVYDNGSGWNEISANATTGIVTLASDATQKVASVKASFEISLTISQVD